MTAFTPAPVKPVVSLSVVESLDIGYADGLLPVLSTPERRVPDGARAG